MSEDDTWEVEPEQLARVLAPSGDVRLMAADLGGTPYRLLDVEAMLGALQASLGDVEGPWEGEIEAKYRGSSQVDGVHVGRIELAIEVTAESNVLPRMQRSIEAVGAADPDKFTDLTLAWTLSGEAVLLWDLDAGHARSFTLEGEVEAEAHLAYTESLFGEEAELEGVYTVSGDTSFEMSVDE